MRELGIQDVNESSDSTLQTNKVDCASVDQDWNAALYPSSYKHNEMITN